MGTTEITTADKIKAARLNAGLTQERLAELAGVCVRTVHNNETGFRHPTRATLRVLAEALGVDVSDLKGP